MGGNHRVIPLHACRIESLGVPGTHTLHRIDGAFGSAVVEHGAQRLHRAGGGPARQRDARILISVRIVGIAVAGDVEIGGLHERLHVRGLQCGEHLRIRERLHMGEALRELILGAQRLGALAVQGRDGGGMRLRRAIRPQRLECGLVERPVAGCERHQHRHMELRCALALQAVLRARDETVQRARLRAVIAAVVECERARTPRIELFENLLARRQRTVHGHRFVCGDARHMQGDKQVGQRNLPSAFGPFLQVGAGDEIVGEVRECVYGAVVHIRVGVVRDGQIQFVAGGWRDHRRHRVDRDRDAGFGGLVGIRRGVGLLGMCRAHCEAGAQCQYEREQHREQRSALAPLSCRVAQVGAVWIHV